MNSQQPLSWWYEGKTKSSIINFVEDITNPKSKNFIPPQRRISTFDNDGTLWCENPVVQAQFIFERVKAMLPDHPEWKHTYPFKSIVDGDVKSIVDDFHNGGKDLVEILYATHTDITQHQFCGIVKSFFDTAIHPRYNRNFKEIAYAPMVELLYYLRENQFKTYICSGGGTDFMRIISEEIYGIVPENVIGSSIKTKFHLVNGKVQLLRTPELFHFDDREGKATGIDHYIGRVPVIAAGNVRAGGDIAMLTYCQSNELPSLQLLINHDDADREYEYSESDSRSLNAAKENGWTVVSMKNDWKRIFTFE